MDPPIQTPTKVRFPWMIPSRKTAIAASAISAVLIFFLTGAGSGSIVTLSTSIAAALACALLTYTILTTGVVNRYRLALFIIIGLAFTVSFSIEQIVQHGSILNTPAQYPGIFAE